MRETKTGPVDKTGDYGQALQGKNDNKEWDGLYYWWISYEVFGLQGSAEIDFYWWNAAIEYDYKITVEIDAF